MLNITLRDLKNPERNEEIFLSFYYDGSSKFSTLKVRGSHGMVVPITLDIEGFRLLEQFIAYSSNEMIE